MTRLRRFAPPFPVSTHQKGIALLTWPFSLTGYPSILRHISYNSHCVSEVDSILLPGLSATAATENRGGPADHLEIKLATSSDRSRIGMYGSSGRRSEGRSEGRGKNRARLIHVPRRRWCSRNLKPNIRPRSFTLCRSYFSKHTESRADNLAATGVLVGAALEADGEEEKGDITHGETRPRRRDDRREMNAYMQGLEVYKKAGARRGLASGEGSRGRGWSSPDRDASSPHQELIRS